jgi:modulator of FtsH protease
MSEIMSHSMNSQNQVMRNTYSLLAFTLLPTIAGSFIGMQIPFETYMLHPILWFFGSLLASFGALFLAAANRNNSSGVFFTLLFTGIMGFTLAPTLQHTLHLQHGAMIIAQAAGLSAFALFASAIFITITKKNFSFLGNLLSISLWVLIGASIIGIFFHTPLFHLILSSIAVIIFVGYLLYDLSSIINGGETNYIMATINIYLDIMNIFINLLNILGILDSKD